MNIKAYHVSRKTILDDFMIIKPVKEDNKLLLEEFIKFLGSNGYLNLAHIKFKVILEETQ